MRRFPQCLLLALAISLAACQMPSPSGPSAPSGSSGSSGPSGPSGPSGSAGGASGPSGSSSGGGSSGGGVAMPSGGGASGGSTGEAGTGGGGMPSGGASGGQSGGPEGTAGGSAGTGPGGDGDSLDGLDESLDESLEEFDDAIAGSGSGSGPDTIDILTQSGSSASQADGPLFEEGDIGSADGPIANSEIEKRAEEGAPPGTESNEQVAAAGGAGQEGEAGEVIPVPDDVGDGQGDDIVMRQIRDAAMKEQDPELREKLWDEYRRIKNQS